MEAKSQDRAPYNVTADEDRIIAEALAIAERRVRRETSFTCAKVVGDFFVLRCLGLQHEVFSVAMIDAQNRLIEIQELSRGTLTQAAVYPREVVKAALAANAASVIFHHNHPSGVEHPSRADEELTNTLKQALALVDVNVLDHIITGGARWMSFAEQGFL